jgi:hypothetical protein
MRKWSGKLRLVHGETVANFLKARNVRLLDCEGEGSTIFRNVGNYTPNFVWVTHPKLDDYGAVYPNINLIERTNKM